MLYYENVKNGLAHESPLSPLLSNVYTQLMYKILNDNIQILQHADDIII